MVSPYSPIANATHTRARHMIAQHLYNASRRGNVELTQRLIRAKADVNFRGAKFGNTALMDAATRGHLEAVCAPMPRAVPRAS